MRSLIYPLLLLTLAACERQTTPSAPASPAGAASQPVARSTGPETPPPKAPATVPSAPLPDPYRLLGVLDPELDGLVAFALKVPREWQAKQSFTRRWTGALPENQVYLSLRSPDGRSQIEYLPSSGYSYSEGPMSENLRAQNRALGSRTDRRQ